MKKILMFLLLGMFLINFVSAELISIDNKATYSEDDMIMNIKDFFGYGVDYGNVKLASHKNTTEIKKVGTGEQEVFRIEGEGKKDYNDILGKTYFTNMKNGKEEDLYYYWEMATSWNEEDVQDDPILICKDIYTKINDSYSENCEYKSNGTHKEKIVRSWKKVDGEINIKEGEDFILRLIVNVGSGDFFDVKIDIYGKRTEKWAAFENPVYDAHGVVIDNADPVTGKVGMRISLNGDRVIVNSTKSSNCGATKGYIYSDNNFAPDTLLNSSDFVGDLVTFNFDATGYTNVWILADNGGAGYNDGFSNVVRNFTSSPVIGTNLNWTKSTGATGDDRRAYGIVSVTTGNPLASIEINILKPDEFVNSTLYDIEYSFTNSSLTDKCWYSNNTGVTNSTPVPCGNNWTGITGNEGTNNIYVCGNLTNGATACSNKSFIIDITAPVLNFTSITNGQTNITGYTNDSRTNITQNWITTDTNLANCSFFNITSGLNESIVCGTNVTFYAPFANYSFYVYAEDYAGNKGSKSVNALFDYRVLENSVTYTSPIVEGSPGSFTIDFNVSAFAGLSVSSVKLIYDNVPYNSTISSVDGNNMEATNTITIPSVSTNIDKQFYYNIILSDASSYNSSLFNQSIINLGFDDCSTFSDVLYSFYLVDEEHQTNLTADVTTTMEVYLTILDSKRTSILANFSNSYVDINPANICLNASLLGSSSVPSDLIVRYYGEDYAKEYYNVYNYSISNSTLYQNITLYDLNLTGSTEFKIVLQDTDYTPISGALIMIDRQYISENNTFKTIEVPITDTNGQTLGHFVKNDIVYNIRAIKDGVIVSTLNNVIAFCEDLQLGNCIITLNPSIGNATLFEYYSEGITFTSPTFSDATNKVSFSFVSTDGGEKNVQMIVTKNDIYGNRSVCSDSVDSVSGTLECSIPGDFSDASINVEIKSNGNTTAIRSIKVDNPDYGSVGYVLWFVLTLVSIIFFLESKTGILISLSFSYIGAVSLAIIKGDIIGLGSAGVWILLITIVGVWKLNRGRQQ